MKNPLLKTLPLLFTLLSLPALAGGEDEPFCATVDRSLIQKISDYSNAYEDSVSISYPHEEMLINQAKLLNQKASALLSLKDLPFVEGQTAYTETLQSAQTLKALVQQKVPANEYEYGAFKHIYQDIQTLIKQCGGQVSDWVDAAPSRRRNNSGDGVRQQQMAQGQIVIQQQVGNSGGDEDEEEEDAEQNVSTTIDDRPAPSTQSGDVTIEPPAEKVVTTTKKKKKKDGNGPTQNVEIHIHNEAPAAQPQEPRMDRVVVVDRPVMIPGPTLVVPEPIFIPVPPVFIPPPPVFIPPPPVFIPISHIHGPFCNWGHHCH